MKDKLQQVCRIIGQADELVIITKNLYGEYSAAVKNMLDRSIGTSTPFSTYRGRQMHHTLRYGKHDLWKGTDRHFPGFRLCGILTGMGRKKLVFSRIDYREQ